MSLHYTEVSCTQPLVGFIDAKIPVGMKQVITRFRAKYLQGFGLEYYVK